MHVACVSLCICALCVLLTSVDRVCHRCSVVEFERPTSDEALVEARRDTLPVMRAQSLEYGKFRTREGGASFPDTFWFSLVERRAAGCSTADLRAAVDSYQEELTAASEEAFVWVECEEEGSESEEEDDLVQGVGEVGRAALDGVDAMADLEET